MKTLMAALAIAFTATQWTTPADAQNGPWCAHYDFGNDETVNCSFYSFQQCLADVHGVGGFCSQNSTYGLSRRPPRYRNRY